MINQNKKASVAKRFLMETEDDDFRPTAKVGKADSSLQRLLYDREEVSN
jgi:hypothetical protein